MKENIKLFQKWGQSGMPVSGELKPTPGDLDLTDRLIQVGKIVNVPVVEHLIISLEGYYSFSRQGDIKRLEKSKKYVPGYLEVERIQKRRNTGQARKRQPLIFDYKTFLPVLFERLLIFL